MVYKFFDETFSGGVLTNVQSETFATQKKKSAIKS